MVEVGVGNSNVLFNIKAFVIHVQVIHILATAFSVYGTSETQDQLVHLPMCYSSLFLSEFPNYLRK